MGQRVDRLDYLVALGTHPPMDDTARSRLVGSDVVDGRAGRSRIFNHRWDLEETFVTVGAIPAETMAAALPAVVEGLSEFGFTNTGQFSSFQFDPVNNWTNINFGPGGGTLDVGVTVAGGRRLVGAT